MSIYNLIEYSDNYSKTSGDLQQYYSCCCAVTNFHAVNNNALFKFKQEITGETGNVGTKNAEIMIPLKYLSNFWRTLEMPLINWKINLILTLQ